MEPKITPKGLACLAMRDSGIVNTIMDNRCDQFWELFCSYLNSNGYSLPGIPDHDMALRIAQLEEELEKYMATDLTIKDMRFFTSPQMVDICKRIEAMMEKK